MRKLKATKRIVREWLEAGEAGMTALLLFAALGLLVLSLGLLAVGCRL